MIAGTYSIRITGILGITRGKLVLRIIDGNLNGYFDILGKKNYFNGEIKENKISFGGEIKLPITTVMYSAEGMIIDDRIDLDMFTEKGNMSIKGRRD